MKSVLVMLKLPVICLASQWHWGLSLGLIWDQPGEFWLNWTKPNTWSDWHKLLLFNQKVKAISLKCLVSILWEKSWLLRKDGFFLHWSGYCSPFRTSKAHWYCILWWRNIRAHFMEIFFCFNKCLWICKLILALINEGMWFIVIFSDRI